MRQAREIDGEEVVESGYRGSRGERGCKVALLGAGWEGNANDVSGDGGGGCHGR